MASIATAPSTNAAPMNVMASSVETPNNIVRSARVASAAPHRRDRAVDAAPRRHHHHRRRALLPLDARQQIQPLGTGRCIARIVHVHEQRIEVAGFDGGENRARRGCGLDFEALSFQEQFEGFQDVSLIIGDKETRWAIRHAVKFEGLGRLGARPRVY